MLNYYFDRLNVVSTIKDYLLSYLSYLMLTFYALPCYGFVRNIVVFIVQHAFKFTQEKKALDGTDIKNIISSYCKQVCKQMLLQSYRLNRFKNCLLVHRLEST